MAQFRLTEFGVYDVEDNLHIPNDPGNRHWIEYQEWLSVEGNEPDPMPVQLSQTAVELGAIRRQQKLERLAATNPEAALQHLIKTR